MLRNKTEKIYKVKIFILSKSFTESIHLLCYNMYNKIRVKNIIRIKKIVLPGGYTKICISERTV